jgi:hypothetical protein
MSYDAYYAAQNTIYDFLYKDAFGPVAPDEILEEPPLDAYVCGILWPKRTQASSIHMPASKQEDLFLCASPDADFGGEPEEEQADVIREANQFRPSVMAISFALPASAKSIEVSFSAGIYESIDVPVEGKDYILHHYNRIGLGPAVLALPLSQRSFKVPLFQGRALLRLVRRKQLSDDAVLWTVSIENTKSATPNEIEQNISALFQCSLTLSGTFCPIDDSSRTSKNTERQKQDFLYREKHSYAAGHGCSVSWDSSTTAVTKIASTFLPKSSVSQMIAVTDNTVSCFKMCSWADENKALALQELADYVQRYSAWADALQAKVASISSSFQSTAQDLLSNIQECLVRLNIGIQTLRNNPTAWNAFCLMNKAMMRQSAKKRNQSETDVTWYPFQLCYVLMCLSDITNPHSKWRNTVDLLWFPTGGGKTEAYLGVAAFTIFYRRLTKGDASRGVTVLMRYTLRMLTAQQYERAAALICECDVIRRQEHLPGGEISIGLWVGGEVTPNHVSSDLEGIETAESIIAKLKAGRTDEVRASPAQLAACPYCGTPLLPANAYIIRNHQLKTHCPNVRCPFHDDLPVVTVDDDIYIRKPTLLIGTIDKFARLAWEEKTGSIFAEDGIGLPPELLIQDELHLISGPLGSVSGLYEIALEELCSQAGIKPKILASTATLCNAAEQINALYGRPAFQFPPSGFSSDDSFFARKATSAERPERLYLGYCETGGSLADALVRVFGVIRFAVQYLIHTGTAPEVIDQFWTNVGYFNSLKDLGSADTLILDRVRAYAESLRLHKFYQDAARVKMDVISNEYEYGELTSRKSSREIAEVRSQLDKQHYPSPAALNYVLSSNMLSVGIDINRLGLMTVYGQPKSTSEYIQATSRVGRSNPGFVVVLLHMLRTRDKSHYEQFQSYHQTLNKMVEPTSVTPYACRSLDKALHAVFIILVRHKCPGMNANQDAAKFRESDPRVQQIYRLLLQMLQARSPETAPYAQNILEDFMHQWNVAAVDRGSHFQYQLLNNSEDTTDALLIPAERDENAIFPPTMNSMRNVDTQSGVYLKRSS